MATDAEILTIAIPQLERDEDKRNAAYLDSKGIPTIGVGHTGREVHLGLVWTDGQIAAALHEDVDTVLEGLDSAIAWWRGLDAVRAAVFVNIGFNAGVHGLLKFPKMLGHAEAGDYDGAAAEILNSEIAPLRRQRLANQMRSGVVQ